MTRVRIEHPSGDFLLAWDTNHPVTLGSGNTRDLLPEVSNIPLVEVFTTVEQRSRTSQGYVFSAVGQRLRHVCHEAVELDDRSKQVTVAQRDPSTGLVVTTRLTQAVGTRTLRAETSVFNDGPEPQVLTLVSSMGMGFGDSQAQLDHLVLSTARSEWLSENRWSDQQLREVTPSLNLPLHAQDARGHHTLTSHGSWSTGEHLPVGTLHSRDSHHSLAWQIESGGPWHVDISQTADGGVLGLFGPTDLEHQFAHQLLPGETFEAVPAAIALSAGGRDGALGELTRYRRWLLHRDGGAGELPIVYNDFMNTLMGQPSTEALLPLIDAAAQAGAEYFCIDAGWFADPNGGDWWSDVGEWREHPDRFSGGGLRGVIEHIHRKGMKSGIWLEPEVIGVNSPVAASLPEEAFFRRFGQRVQEHERYHLDFRHAAARAHLDATVDHLVAQFGISFLKLDYNINPGAGTEEGATSAASGLIGHARAYREWLVAIQRRHPGLLIENCSSGAMRADYSLLSVVNVQSTTDQQDFLRYPPIAAAAPTAILPEQSGNWAYPSAEMSLEETAFTLVTGLSGRFYLSGFLHELSDAQNKLVRQAIGFHGRNRDSLRSAIPSWPLGLPGWEDSVVSLRLSGDRDDLLFVWSRGQCESEVLLPLPGATLTQVFPTDLEIWTTTPEATGIRLSLPATPAGRVFRVS